MRVPRLCEARHAARLSGRRSAGRPCRAPLGEPDCAASPATGKLGAFAFEPIGCAGSACTSIRALLFSFDPNPIPDGVLYSCHLDVAPGAPSGPHALAVFGVVLATPGGESVPGVSGVDGTLTVLDPCGNGSIDPGEQCDDGNRSAGDLCPASCRYTAGHSAIRGRTTRPTTDRSACQVEWYVVAPGAAPDRFGLPARDVHCADQDASCDFDPTVGRCRFQVVACASNDDPALACTPSGISSLTVREPRPQTARDPAVRAALTADAAAIAAAFQSLLDPLDPGAGYAASVPIDAARRNLCSAPFPIDAFVRSIQRGAVKITTRSKDNATPRPRSNLSRPRLTCD